MKRFIPKLYVNCIQDINIKMLKAQGIRVFILDIDNTLVPTSTKEPTKSVIDWIETVKSEDIKVCLVSNNSKKRVTGFNKNLSLYAIHRAFKPLKRGFQRVAKKYGVSEKEVCVVGDQIFTDIWGANRAKMMSILVLPLSTDEGLGIRLKRYIENVIINKTKIQSFELIGNPVKHSMSPILHNAVYNYYDINAEYLLNCVEDIEIGQVIEKFKQTGVKGFNITVPHKQNIIPFIDEVSDSAKQIGAVNTVKIIDGKLYGYNTDGDGFLMQLKGDGVKVKNCEVKIVGAGGSTMSIVYALVSSGCKGIKLYNRTVENAQKISNKFSNVIALPIDEFDASNCDILINTTSVGLSPNNDESPVTNLDNISKNTVVYDLIYNPPVTRFMQMAIKKGCKAHNGYKMLIYQGLIADEIWFGRKIIRNKLVNIILKELEKGVK